MTTRSPVRLPGRRRFGGVFSGGTETLVAYFAIGLLASAYFKLDWWHKVLIGQSLVDDRALLGLALACCALRWKSLLRRTFVWAEPAALTWLDFTFADRSVLIARRLWRVWLTDLLALAYVIGLVTAVYEPPSAVWLTCAAVLAASGLFALGLARRASANVVLEAAWPLALAFAGLVCAAAPAPLTWWFALAGLLAAGAVWSWWGSGSPRRPAVANAGRTQLVDKWNERLVRTVAVTFLDPLMMLPSANQVGGRSLGTPAVLRLALHGVRARARFAVAALLSAVIVPVALVALPRWPDVPLVALAGYGALVPFGAGLGEIWGVPGRRRWIGSGDGGIRAWHAAVLAGIVAIWTAALLAAGLVAGVHFSAGCWLALPVVAASVVRTVTRPPIDYGAVGATDTPMGQLPAGLVKQFLRGPDVLVFATVVLTIAPVGWFSVLVVAWCTALCFWR